METIERIKTDIYPTRYTAFNNPGKWAIFAPVNGYYRSCKEDGPSLPIQSLGAGVSYPGEMAVLYVPMPNPVRDGIVDGACIEIGGSAEPRRFWGSHGPESGFRAKLHFTAPDAARRQTNASLFAPTLEEAIAQSEKWLMKVKAEWDARVSCSYERGER